MTAMKLSVRQRLYIAIVVGTVVATAYYAVEFHRGYVKQGFGYFPFVVGFTDHIAMRSPLFELAAITAILFGVLSLPSLLEKKTSGHGL
jgi:hypothetical protein